MANVCSYSYKVIGAPNNCEAFLKVLASGSYYGDISKDESNSLSGFEGGGSCKWSVSSSLIDGYRANLPDACEKYKVRFEIYSEEPGECFQEHYLINDDGVIEIDDVVEWTEYINWDEFESKKEFEEEYGPCSDDEWASYVNEGHFERGGFDEWVFEI